MKICTNSKTNTKKFNPKLKMLNNNVYVDIYYSRYSLSRIVLIASIFFNIVITFGHSALLTNIYGNKLSEITDISHRYLIVPSPTALNSSSTDVSHSTSPELYRKIDDSIYNEENQNKSSTDKSVENPVENGQVLVPEALVSSQNLVASPWKSPGQSSGQLLPQTKVKSLIQSIANSSGSSNGINDALKRQLLLDEAKIMEISTEFPNPNINNLGHEITKILKRFFIYGYDKRVRPNYSGPPALVNVSFHIIGISSVDEVQMDFTTDFYFRQKWFDPRLEFDPVGEIDELCVGAEFAEKIWLPDTFFANEKAATFHKATTENTFIRIAHNGRVYRSIRLTVTCSCPMDLQYFPMDRQRCKIEIESYGYNTRDIDYRWERGDASVTLNTKIELPQFKILGFKMGQEIQNLSSGDYIRLYCEIHFVRSMGYYLIQIYIPASLIVIISWVSFWLHRNATPARVALGVTTVLTMTTLMSSTNAALPKISYIKSIDVFLGTCFVMVFASLLEYASVGYIGKRIAMKRKRLQDLQQMQQHHQKVCVAAAASAAAAAAAAANQETTNPMTTFTFNPKDVAHNQSLYSQTLNRKSSANSKPPVDSGYKTIQRGTNCSGQNPRSSLKMTPDQSRVGPNNDLKKRSNALNISDQSREPLLTPAPMSTGLNQPQSQGPTTEFEVSQTQDMIRICGLTPSSIDKHSRVVFPICFVCFNLMYWIIYGHISQQVEDKGPPLIPFINT